MYIGQTVLEHHLKEHRKALVSGNTAQSAVAKHAVNQMHDINWTGAEVVDSHSYYCQRCALEAWHICLKHQVMNRDEGPLLAVYNPLDSSGTSTCSLTAASNYSTFVYHCACEWTATIITSYFLPSQLHGIMSLSPAIIV